MRTRFLKSGLSVVAVMVIAMALFCGMTGAAAFAEEKPEIFPQLGQSGWIQQIAMSNDGKYLLTGDFGGTVMLWETETGREIRKLPGESHLDSIAFSPDGKYAVCNQAVTVRLLDLLTGRQIYAAKKKDPYNGRCLPPRRRPVLHDLRGHVSPPGMGNRHGPGYGGAFYTRRFH